MVDIFSTRNNFTYDQFIGYTYRIELLQEVVAYSVHIICDMDCKTSLWAT